MLLPSLTLLLTTAAFTVAQLVVPNLDHDQRILMDETHQNKPDSRPTDYDDFVRAPRLSDIMTLEPRASIFFSYARESAKLSGILSGEVENEDGKKYTVFVPINRAVMALPRKPYVRPRALLRPTSSIYRWWWREANGLLDVDMKVAHSKLILRLKSPRRKRIGNLCSTLRDGLGHISCRCVCLSVYLPASGIVGADGTTLSGGTQ